MKDAELGQKIIEVRAKAGPSLTPIIDRTLEVVRELDVQVEAPILADFVALLEAALPLPVPPPEEVIEAQAAPAVDYSPEARRDRRKGK